MLKYFIPLLLLISLNISCTSDKAEIQSHQLNGEWEMIHYSSLLVASIESDEIRWTFNIDENKLWIENSIESKYPFILASGNYLIEVINDKIVIELLEYNYIVEGNQLTISNNPEVDGPLMIFRRK